MLHFHICIAVLWSGPIAVALRDLPAFDLVQPRDRVSFPDDAGPSGLRGDDCGDALYSQFGTRLGDWELSIDGRQAGWIESWIADDAVVEQRAEITGIVGQFWGDPSKSFERMDAIVTFKTEAGPGRVIVEVQDSERCTFDQTDQLWTFSVEIPPTRVVPGEYFAGLRPVVEEVVEVYMLTTETGRGDQAYFQSADLDFPDWVPVNHVLEYPSDFSFCLLGHYVEEEFGACCTDGAACSVLTRAECDAAGGAYQGVDQPCFTNPCPDARGACCFVDPYTCTDRMSQSECESQGGAYRGGDSECKSVRCPLPDLCAGSLYSQLGFDGSSALFNQDSADIPYVDAWAADDVTLTQRSIVSGIVVQTFVEENPAVEFEDAFLAYPSLTGGPGKLLRDVNDTQDFTRLSDGTPFWSGTVWTSQVRFPATRVVPGTYFTSAREKIDERVHAFLLTSGTGGGSPGYFKGTIGDNEKWITTEYIRGGVPLEFSFCLIGSPTDVEFGGCCLPGETKCELQTPSECDAAGGRYLGTDAPCFPSPCENARGACCFERPYNCRNNYTQANCEAQGGTFFGGDSQCAFTWCPLPNWCAEALYSQFGHDDDSSLGNHRSERSSSESNAADDFTVNVPCELTGIVIEETSWVSSEDDIKKMDWFVWYTAPGGIPSKPVAARANVRSFERLTDRSRSHLDDPVYRTRVDFDTPVRIVPGQYYFSARPVTYETNSKLLTSASGGGSDSYFRADYKEQDIPWISEPEYRGRPIEFSMCILGAPTNLVFGACCTADDATCALLTPEECDAAGGSYRGDNVSCLPSPCANAPGACCLETGACEFGSRGQCDEHGGNFQGGDIACESVLCPLPEVCDGSIYSNNVPDRSSRGYSCEGGGWIDPPSETADDFEVDSPVIIDQAHWFATTYTNYSATTADVLVYADAGGHPAIDPLIRLNVPASFDNTNGDRLTNNIPFVRWSVTGLQIALEPGVYWIVLRPVFDSGQGRNYWATAGDGTIVGREGHFRSTFFGYADWTSSRDLAGGATDLAFCLNAAAAAPCGDFLRGDSDGSGSVDFDDLGCFVSALISYDNWRSCGTRLEGDVAWRCANDIDQNGRVNFDDIDGFVECLINNGCP